MPKENKPRGREFQGKCREFILESEETWGFR